MLYLPSEEELLLELRKEYDILEQENKLKTDD